MLNLSKKGHISELVSYSGIYIGSEIVASGDIKSEEDIYIDGKYKGTIETTGAVEIGKNAMFTGTILSRSAIIEGFVKANVVGSDTIHIAGCGQLQGNAKSKNISIDPGAILNLKAITE